MGTPLTRPTLMRRVRPRRRWRAVGFAILGLVLVAAAAAGGGYAYLRRSLPQVTGTLALAGLQAPVTVYRDDWGVPHIVAANRHDLYYAQGFVTAQDRLFQMEVKRRAAAGRISELFGEVALDTDRLFRSLMLRRAAEASVQAFPPEVARLVQAYADGVNAYIDQAGAAGRLPPEFLLLGYRPEPWTPADSASVAKLMAYDLSRTWQSIVWRYQLIQRVGAEKAGELLPEYPADAPVIMKYLQNSGEELEYLVRTAGLPAEGLGSNNWVLAGSRTASGRPLLANDPHLGMGTPSVWYQTHLSLPAEQLNIIGVSLAGIPGVVIGHNDHVAWGMTNLGPHVQDLYVEIPNPDNPREFLYNGRYEPAQVLVEDIKVKGKDQPVPFNVLVTRHGPIITQITGSKDARPEAALALRWTAHGPTQELAAAVSMNSARNWQEFREGLKSFQVPAQNFVFAATDGTIAYRGNGQIPVRKKGNGTLPVPGWTDEYEWTGFIPFDELPEVVNPPEGFIATANAKVVDDAYPYFISSTWAPRYRHERIREVLLQARGWTVKEMQALQTDYANLQAARLLPVLLPSAEEGLADATALEKAALAALKAWDRVDSTDSPGPAIYHTWYRHLQRELYVPTMGPALFERMTEATQITDRLVLAAGEGKVSSWFPADGLAGVAARSFRKAIADLQKQLGGRVSAWEWGKLHVIPLNHDLGRVKPLHLLFNVGPRPVGGSGVTVGAASFSRVGPGFAVTSSAPWRQVVDLADPAGNSWDVTVPGQGGHPLGRHYADQVGLWLKGQYHPQLVTAEQLKGARRLELVPAS